MRIFIKMHTLQNSHAINGNMSLQKNYRTLAQMSSTTCMRKKKEKWKGCAKIDTPSIFLDKKIRKQQQLRQTHAQNN